MIFGFASSTRFANSVVGFAVSLALTSCTTIPKDLEFGSASEMALIILPSNKEGLRETHYFVEVSDDRGVLSDPSFSIGGLAIDPLSAQNDHRMVYYAKLVEPGNYVRTMHSQYAEHGTTSSMTWFCHNAASPVLKFNPGEVRIFWSNLRQNGAGELGTPPPPKYQLEEVISTLSKYPGIKAEPDFFANEEFAKWESEELGYWAAQLRQTAAQCYKGKTYDVFPVNRIEPNELD